MPSSPPEPPPADANTSDKGTSSTGASAMGAGAIVLAVFVGLWYFLWNLGAASLSYAKYGSIGWAILDFFFAPFYYPYYALVLNTPAPTMFGGRRRKMW